MENSRERLLRYLNDAWSVEKALVGNLKDMASEVNDPQIRSLFLEHSVLTHQQEERLEMHIRQLGEEPSTGKGLLATLMGKIGDALGAMHDEHDKTVQNLIKAYGIENFESAMYEAMEAYAKAIGDEETAALARTHHAEEEEAARKLWPLIAPAASRVRDVVPA